ncbi:oxidoreductase family protein [Thermosporothrix hazakensis]|jgi:predicted dehydrogenase|uniref:Oxidoreductase family protein n=1 Tax=Thermosporothrix hazakensis TaxID=644383 RepID=A0A326U5T0_THEHA|nr:Gfo/Idh/MocA family oxidoreductase [Thermosporothrix hazakensis]PZW29301.1 oxidoreductase family protein [Thermosporothrix hazakensis]GCE45347.1 oxidoreductase [Thermosporothrix hazakensis]
MEGKPVEILIVGAGSRGTRYAAYALEHPDLARVVAVAEPREAYRTRLVEQHAIAPENVYTDWRDLIERPKCADAVVIATQDADHLEPTLAFAAKGYAILLEKPMAPDAESCRRIVEAIQKHKVLFAVGHVLRYTAYTQQLKAVLDAGVIGDLVSIQHLEPVGFWHYAHSYVRGNWRNTAESSFMLLAKSCHDIDWLRYMIGARCVQVSSFGSLLHFRKEQKPVEAGTALRCLDCSFEAKCPYSAKRFYLDQIRKQNTGWPIDVITTDFTEEGVLKALAEGPYGRCVYECDNDVVDHQVVNLAYENGVTASFTMISTSEQRDRETILFGTRGELRGNGERIVHYDFLTQTTREIPIQRPETALSGHGGGDYGLMQHFVAAVARNDPGKVLSGPEETLETHLTVFAAEQARLTNQVVRIG